MRISDWSSDVCSSDLTLGIADARRRHRQAAVVEALHRGAETDPFLAAEQRVAIDTHIFQDHVGDLRPRLAHLAVGLADRPAGRIAGTEGGADMRTEAAR